MTTQHEQFIEWFLPEDDSIEEPPSAEVTTKTRLVPEASASGPSSTERRVRGYPTWILFAISGGGLIGALATWRLELVPIWLAFALLCALVRSAQAARAAPPRTEARGEAPSGEPVSAPFSVKVAPSPDDVTFEPLVRADPPVEGDEPLSCILVEDRADGPYRNAWVIVTFLVTNRSEATFAFVCRRLKLRWCGEHLDLQPIDMTHWTLGPYKAVKVSTISHVWTDQLPALVHTTTGELTVHLDCRTTGSSLEIGLRPRVWTSALRPAFSDEGPIHLAPGPVGARTDSRAHAVV